jgi:S-adenosylmethionine:tRNA-ribosyltransferase-isomerase (queuine synthetase)
VKKEEMAKVQAFLRKRFENQKIELRVRPKKTDSVEVYIGKRDEDFLAVLYREEEDGEISYQFQMAILDIDLEDV